VEGFSGGAWLVEGDEVVGGLWRCGFLGGYEGGDERGGDDGYGGRWL
jgi:hypothetical protein